MLTILFVMIAEILIFVPSAANYRLNWLRDHVESGELASLVVQAAAEQAVTSDLAMELLETAGVVSVAIKREGVREFVLGAQVAQPVQLLEDLREHNAIKAILDMFGALVAPPGRMIRAINSPRFAPVEFVEIVVSEAGLKADLLQYSIRILWLSLIIASVTGSLMYLTLVQEVASPMRRIAAAIAKFEAAPQDVGSIMTPSARKDEIGQTERALARMQEQIRQAFAQRERLAQLGAAVAKISHDLRNSLAAAQIVTDNLSASEDPKVRVAAPRLQRAIERALNMAAATLSYGRTEERMPDLQPFDLLAGAEEAAAEAFAAHPRVIWRNDVDPSLFARADREHAHRIFVNIMRNAAQALEAVAEGQGRPQVTARAARLGDYIIIEFVDNGPGIPERVRERLFTPFVASQKKGGSGLGLAIARELARAMGGDVTLERTSSAGTVIGVKLRVADVDVGGSNTADVPLGYS